MGFFSIPKNGKIYYYNGIWILLNKEINSNRDQVNQNLNRGNLYFDYATDGLYYNVKVGADTVRKKCSAEYYTKPFSVSGIYGVIDLSDVANYKNISIDNTYISILSGYGGHIRRKDNFNNLDVAGIELRKSYDSATGQLRFWLNYSSIGVDATNAFHEGTAIIFII